MLDATRSNSSSWEEPFSPCRRTTRNGSSADCTTPCPATSQPPSKRPFGMMPPCRLMACRYSEQSNSKCVAITIETRPDYCLKPHLNNMLSFGCTRIEIGVQSIYEVCYPWSPRGDRILRETPTEVIPLPRSVAPLSSPKYIISSHL